MIKMKCLIFSFQWYPYMCYVMSGRPWKSSLKFLAKNFGKHFKGLPEIKEQNQLHIWNQHEKYYKMWYFQNANPKFAEKNLSNEWIWVILSEFFKGLPDIREENQIHIWNQHAKNYQTLCFQKFWTLIICPLNGSFLAYSLHKKIAWGGEGWFITNM